MNQQNGLDPIGIAEIRKLLKELVEVHGKTILISSHQLSEIEQIADVIGILHDGALLEECDMSQIAQHNQPSSILPYQMYIKRLVY